MKETSAIVADPLEPLVGKEILDRRYRVEALLGRGGQCAVFRVRDRKRRTRLAMKVLSPEMAAIPDALARFRREATAGQRIAHPNVAVVHDAGQLADGAHYFVMELLTGRSLADALEAGPLPVPAAVDVAGQVLSGLGAAHALGVAHRDIKPDNVMLIGRRGRERAKIVDFGIAADEHAAQKLTLPGIAFGTPQYLSPEMAMGLPVDARSDQYSMAVVLFEMLTGRLPFEGEAVQDFLTAHATRPPPRASTVAPHIPRALDEVLLRAMDKDPARRFASADAMRRALVAALPARRRTGLRLALGLVAVGAAAAAVLWWQQQTAAPKPTIASPAPAKPKPKRRGPARKD